MKKTIVDYSVDDKATIFKKWLKFDVKNMLELKRSGLWWKEDDRKLYKKYKGNETAQKIIEYFKKKGLK